MINSKCPSCHKLYNIEEVNLGKQAECVNCKVKFVISEEETLRENIFSLINMKVIAYKKIIFIISGILILIAIITTMYWPKNQINNNVNNSITNRTTDIQESNGINLGSCALFSKKLKLCEKFTCEYSVLSPLDGKSKMTIKNDVDGNSESCFHTQEIIKESGIIYSQLKCLNLNQEEISDLADDYDIIMNSDGKKYSYSLDLNGKSSVTVNGKILKNMLNKLTSNGKCDMQFPNIKQ